ncbi:hypothetical protein MIND_00927800 [Mycena indigotica]|uniref:Uncharacterized protein n=1 Tax=Mycena indigotica TaxID=2126181 RepID=A0A8H6W0D1_9AGAR|nr:uncharacterized protein MIND_00927800 [Mycena indigotica]KAF7296958.1 hypothetical protein MIND_00927800 [Mycena indigotica]
MFPPSRLLLPLRKRRPPADALPMPVREGALRVVPGPPARKEHVLPRSSALRPASCARLMSAIVIADAASALSALVPGKMGGLLETLRGIERSKWRRWPANPSFRFRATC